MQHNHPDTLPTTKTCTKCQEVKVLDEFYLHRRGKFGRHSTCKSCHGSADRIKKREAYANPDRRASIINRNRTYCDKPENYAAALARANARYRRLAHPILAVPHPAPFILTSHPGLIDDTARRVVLRLPSSILCSNRPPLTPGGRMATAVAARAYRKLAAKQCDQFNSPEDGPPLWRKASAKLYFFFKDKRRRDIRNFEAGMKAAYDGLVDAGLIIDDNSDVLTHEETLFEIDPANPRVEIIITNKEAA